MNKQIQLLAEQAWDATAVSKDFGHPVSFAEKLAELIVLECVSKAEDYGLGCDAVEELKKYFGVKE